MSVEMNKAVVRRSIEALNTRNWAVLDELTARDYVNHNPLPGAKTGWEGMRDALIGIMNAFPDFRADIDDVIAEGDRVVVRMTVSGTHKGEFMGIAPTNKRVAVGEIIIHRIVGGKVAEEWINADNLGLLQQLCAIPPLGKTGGNS